MAAGRPKRLQFRHIAPALAGQGWQCTFVTKNTDTPAPSGVQKIIYKPAGGAQQGSDPATHSFQSEHAHARAVYEAVGAQ